MSKILKFSIISFIFVTSFILLQKALVAQAPPTCCAYCSTGKACGNGCISKGDTCSKPKGCACDGERPKPKIFEKDKGNDLEVRKIVSAFEYPEEFNSVSQNSQNKLLSFNIQQVEVLQHFGSSMKITQNSSPFKCTVPVVPSPIPRSEQISTVFIPVKTLTVRKRKLDMFLYDDDIVDGDIVGLFVNGKNYGNIILTPKLGKRIEVDLGNEPGDKEIAFRFVKDGGVTAEDGTPLVSLAVKIEERDVVESDFNAKYIKISMKPFQESIMTVIYPRIRISISRYPQSACHIAEAWRIPPVPMEQPIPDKPANPLRASYPRVLTRATKQTATSNGKQSTRNYECTRIQNGRKEQRDEYPQKTFVENYGSAHIKCISASDNEGSGSIIGFQLENYGTKKVKINPNETVELVLVD